MPPPARSAVLPSNRVPSAKKLLAPFTKTAPPLAESPSTAELFRKAPPVMRTSDSPVTNSAPPPVSSPVATLFSKNTSSSATTAASVTVNAPPASASPPSKVRFENAYSCTPTLSMIGPSETVSIVTPSPPSITKSSVRAGRAPSDSVTVSAPPGRSKVMTSPSKSPAGASENASLVSAAVTASRRLITPSSATTSNVVSTTKVVSSARSSSPSAAEAAPTAMGRTAGAKPRRAERRRLNGRGIIGATREAPPATAARGRRRGGL